MTGIDVGYNGAAYKSRLRGVDRTAYKVQFVVTRCDRQTFVRYLVEYGEKRMTHADVFLACGIGRLGTRLSLRMLAEAMNCVPEYDAAHVRECAGRDAVRRDTNLNRYGVEYSTQQDDVKSRIRSTTISKYGGVGMASPELARKTVDTTVARYGGMGMASSLIRDKCQSTMLERYGVRHTFQSRLLLSKQRSTMRSRYGGDTTLSSAELRDKVRATLLRKYGVEHVGQIDGVTEKSLETKRKRGTFNSSVSEDALYTLLVDVFGEMDVRRQYRSDVYPSACDFYVVSRDLYVELNGFRSHMRHWFGQSKDDGDVARALREKQTAFYDNVLDVWTRSDVEKRETARRNGLNYVVFWDPSLADAELWFATGCPNGRDWEREYSWLPDPSAPLVHDGEWPERLTPAAGSGLVGRAVRAATWREFYKRELALWAENYDSKWGTVQARLYANRFKYIGKLPGELTGREILRGLNIAGMVDGYSTFDVAGMRAFLDAYRPESIHDPCAGWGERLVAAALAGVRYRGVDVNPAVVEAHARVVERYGLEGVETVVGDSGELDFSSGDHDCVFTCPPYGSREIYSPAGAENLDAAGFDAWWRRVVANVSGPRTRVFAYQIDAAHRDGMNAALVDAGWRLDREIPVGRERVSHMSRARGATSKRNYESVQVFVR